MFQFQSIANALLMLVLSGISFSVMAAEEAREEILQVQHQNEIAYVSGGIGEEEQKAVEKLGGDFSLQLTLATQDGHYHGGGHVVIQDAQGNTVVDVPSQGPLFYADLKPGTYTVSAEPAEFPGQKAQKNVDITEEKPTSLVFTWGKTPEPEVLRE